MSFSGTPLGQGRRLDRHTFLNKPSSQSNNQPNFHPRLLLHTQQPSQNTITASYAYGYVAQPAVNAVYSSAPSAPTEATRSPPKPPSSLDPSDIQDETALVRYARLKRDQSSLQPEKWNVKDTSVNIAAAFNQAVSSSYDMPPNNPNAAWASGSQTNLGVPRSTSVEYEKETHSTSSRRLAPPPNRLTHRKSISKQASALTHVSDSEPEQSQSFDNSARGKSPFEQVLDISKRAINTATSFYLRQRSTEPADVSAATTNGKESSLDYEELDREYSELHRQRAHEDEDSFSRKSTSSHRRNRISLDNKAYRPSMSDLEDSDDQISDEGKRRRKKIKKKDLGPGTLTSLPVAGYDKRRRRKKGSKGGEVDEAEDDQESSISSEQVSFCDSCTQPWLISRSIPPRSLQLRAESPCYAPPSHRPHDHLYPVPRYLHHPNSILTWRTVFPTILLVWR